MNINPVLNESNIGGQDYLRNLVHLPFFLQNAALRKVKHVKMLENSMKRNSRLEDDPGPQIIVRSLKLFVLVLQVVKITRKLNICSCLQEDLQLNPVSEYL